MSKLVQKWKKVVGCSSSKKEALIENDFLQTADPINNTELVKKGFRQKRNCSLPESSRRFNFFTKTSHSCDHCGDDDRNEDEEGESTRMLSSPDSTGEHHHSIINKSSNSTYDSIHEYENVVASKNNSFLVNQNTIEDLSSHSHRFSFMMQTRQQQTTAESQADPSLKDSSNTTSLSFRSLKRVLGSKTSFSRSQKEKDKYKENHTSGFGYDELADSPLLVKDFAQNKLKSSKSARTFQVDENNNVEYFNDDTHIYYEIDRHVEAGCGSGLTEDEPLLINFTESEPVKKQRATKQRNDI